MGDLELGITREFFFYNKILSSEKPSKIIENMIKTKTKIKYLVALIQENLITILFLSTFFMSWFEINFTIVNLKEMG